MSPSRSEEHKKQEGLRPVSDNPNEMPESFRDGTFHIRLSLELLLAVFAHLERVKGCSTMRSNTNVKQKDDFVAVAIVVTVAIAVASLVWFHRKNKSDDDGYRSAAATANPEELEKTFMEAAARVRKLDDVGTGEQLVLYALYKQSTNGDAPARFAASNLGKKWGTIAAWNNVRGIPKSEAMLRYISAVKDIESNENRQSTETDALLGGPAVSMPAVDNGGYDDSKEAENSPTLRLLRAASKDEADIVEEILKSGAVAADHQDASGQTALHLAADRGSLKVVTKLLEHGANPSAVDQDGISVLQAAVIAGNVDTARFLLEMGADPDHPDRDGDTPRACAIDDGSGEMKKLFFKDDESKATE